MTAGDRDDVRRRADELRRAAGDAPDAIDALGIDAAAALWYSPDTEKWADPDAPDDVPRFLIEADDGREYSIHLTELHTRHLSRESPDHALGIEDADE